jgi:hypothetical protein
MSKAGNEKPRIEDKGSPTVNQASPTPPKKPDEGIERIKKPKKATLDTLSNQILSLSESVIKLQESHDKLIDDFAKLEIKIGIDLQSTKAAFDNKIKQLEIRLSKEQKEGHLELGKQWTHQLEAANAVISTLEDQTKVDADSIVELQIKNAAQDTRILQLEESIRKQAEDLENLKELVRENAEIADQKLEELTYEVDEIRILTNNAEAHGRRWAIRVKGFPIPETRPETSDQAKDLILKFLRDKLNLNHIRLDDVDCAHRIGGVRDEKQAIMARFFRRDHVEQILRVKKTLKGKGYVVFEDTTAKNRKLLNALNQHPAVENAWTSGGTVWCKLKTGGPKFKVGINDDLDYAVRIAAVRPLSLLSTARSPTPPATTIEEQGNPDGDPETILSEEEAAADPNAAAEVQTVDSHL